MNMRKIICTAAAIFASAALYTGVSAGNIAGEVISTDIVAFIDEQPIEGYNINDHTYITAEELRGYGFDVQWDAEARTLSIMRDRDAEKVLFDRAKLNVKKTDVVPRQHVYDVYDTDIVTYMNGEVCDAYNVDGQTLVMIDELQRYGYFNYDNGTRTVKISMAKFDADKAYENSRKQELIFEDKTENGYITKKTYSGDVAFEKADGFGRITDTTNADGVIDFNGIYSNSENTYTGEFSGGSFHGRIYHEGWSRQVNGSDRRKREYVGIHSYASGEYDGYQLELTYTEGGEYQRNEYVCENGKVKYVRTCTADDSFRYGYYVSEEGYLDAMGHIKDYFPVEAPKIKKVEADYTASLAIDEDNNLYCWGAFLDAYLTSRTEPIKIDKEISAVSAGAWSESSVIDTNGNLYYTADKIIKYNNTNVPKAGENVVQTSDNLFLTEDGRLYRKPIDYTWTMYDAPTLIDTDVKTFSGEQIIIYLKNDGSVYIARLNTNGVSWEDGKDLSQPVKIMDNAKYVNADLGYFVITNDNTLYTWDMEYCFREKEFNEETEPVKICEAAESVGCLNGSCIVYKKTDGTLWAIPDFRHTDYKALFNITEPVKLMDDVKDFSCGWSHVLIVKNDGTLWSWGRNTVGQLGTGTLEDAETPVQITEFFE